VLLQILDDEQLVSAQAVRGRRCGLGLSHYDASASVPSSSFCASRSFVSSSRWQA
jgi:hypothetical protein